MPKWLLPAAYWNFIAFSPEGEAGNRRTEWRMSRRFDPRARLLGRQSSQWSGTNSNICIAEIEKGVGMKMKNYPPRGMGTWMGRRRGRSVCRLGRDDSSNVLSSLPWACWWDDRCLANLTIQFGSVWLGLDWVGLGWVRFGWIGFGSVWLKQELTVDWLLVVA